MQSRHYDCTDPTGTKSRTNDTSHYENGTDGANLLRNIRLHCKEKFHVSSIERMPLWASLRLFVVGNAVQNMEISTRPISDHSPMQYLRI